MKMLITAESHNQVSWEAQSIVVWIEVGLLISLIIATLLISASPAPWRWILVAGLSTLLVGIGALLAVTMPITEYGDMERAPEGGDIRRAQHWLIGGNRVAWEAPLESISGFAMETRAFEETDSQLYTMARLWAISHDDTAPPQQLTPWGELKTVQSLGESLAKAGRRTFDVSGEVVD